MNPQSNNVNIRRNGFGNGLMQKCKYDCINMQQGPINYISTLPTYSYTLYSEHHTYLPIFTINTATC